MPTSHNQTIDWKSDKAILAFSCLISGPCRQAVVPTRPSDNYTQERMGWTRKEYMRKKDITDAIHIQVALPTLPAFEQGDPSAQPDPAATQPNPAATPQGHSSHHLSPNTCLHPREPG
ncbi:hypothetical protein V6N13_064499 [Hibiscus sabdariffa]